MEKTTTTQQTSAVYVCSVKGCDRRGPAGQMSHVQEFRKPSVDADGQIRNVVCTSCAQDARMYGGDNLAVHPIAETLRILVVNQRRRDDEARVEAARQRAAKEFFGKLGCGAQSVEEDSPQEAARARRAEKQAKRDSRSQEWEARRNGAVNGYLATVG